MIIMRVILALDTRTTRREHTTEGKDKQHISFMILEIEEKTSWKLGGI